jgi:mono/diheme cytochrome c family protein
MLRKYLAWSLAIVGALVVLIQFVPYGRIDPPEPARREPNWDSPQTRALAQRACFDCHSSQTVWPWYAHVAPFSWLLQHDVDDGRGHVNFSDWDRLQRGLRGVRGDVMEGRMPPWYYLPLHSQARLTSEEKETLLQGLAATIAKDPPPQPPPRQHAANPERKSTE